MKLTEEQGQFIEANKSIWLQAPGMSVTDMQLLLTGTKEEIYQWLQEKSKANNDIVGEAKVETSAGIQEEVQGWMSYEDSQKLQEKKDEMAKKVLFGQTPYEGYPGTAADKWYEEKLAEIGKIDYNQVAQETPWNQQLYTSLEQVLEDLQQQKRHLTIMSKLHDTITAGYQIAKKLIEDPGYQISKIEKDNGTR